jgi:hypothetical protein
MNRLSNWQSRLSDYLVAVARTPFQYGRLDCGLFVAGALEAMTGVDVAAELRGYTNRTEAFARIERMCGRPSMEAIADYLAAAFEVHEVPVLYAQRGDVIQLRRGRRASLGIVAMHGTDLLTPYRAGILRAPLALAVRAWHI